MDMHNNRLSRKFATGRAISMALIAMLVALSSVTFLARDQSDPSRAQGSVGIIITSTFQTIDGTEYRDVSTIISSIYDGRVATWSKKLDGRGGYRNIEHRASSSEGYKRIVRNGKGDVLSQDGCKCEIDDIPDVVVDGIGTEGNVTVLEKALDFKSYPIIPSSERDELVNSGAMQLDHTEYMLGYLVNVYRLILVPQPGHERRAMVALTDSGIKLKLEKWFTYENGPAEYVYSARQVATAVPYGDPLMTDVDFDPSIEGPSPVNYREVSEFDPGNGQGISVDDAEYVLYPEAAISSRFALGTSVFISGTWESGMIEEAIDPTGSYVYDSRYWWVVEKIEDSHSEADVAVIQGRDDDIYAPVNAFEAWPPSWQSTKIASSLRWVNTLATTGQFSGGVSYDVYGVSLSTGVEPGWKDPYDFIITWKEQDVIRVVMLFRNLSQQESIELAEQFRLSAQQ